MFGLTRKTDYALIALAFLAERAERVWSAREIARAHDLPLALLMNLLKTLHQHGVLRSTRGAKGGYQIARDLSQMALYDLVSILECSGPAGDCGCLDHVAV